MNYCVRCGNPLPKANNFCGYCGMSVKEMEEIEAAELAMDAAEEATQETTEEAEETETVVEEVAETEEITEEAEEAEETEVADEVDEPSEDVEAEEPVAEETPAEDEAEEETEEEAPAEDETPAKEEAEEEPEEAFTFEDLEEDQEKNGMPVSSPTLALGLDYNYEQAEADLAKLNGVPMEARTPIISRKKAIILGIIAAVIVLGIVVGNVVSGMAATTKVDLAEYIKAPEYGGVDGSGVIVTEPVIDEKKVDEFMATTDDIDARFAIKSFFNGIVLSCDKDSQLKEGDEITITARYSESGAEAAGIKVKNNVTTVTVGKLDVLDAKIIGTWVMVEAEHHGYTRSIRRLGRDFSPEPTFELKADGSGTITFPGRQIKGTVIKKNTANYELKTKSNEVYTFYFEDETLRLDYVKPNDDGTISHDEDDAMVLIFER